MYVWYIERNGGGDQFTCQYKWRGQHHCHQSCLPGCGLNTDTPTQWVAVILCNVQWYNMYSLNTMLLEKIIGDWGTRFHKGGWCTPSCAQCESINVSMYLYQVIMSINVSGQCIWGWWSWLALKERRKAVMELEKLNISLSQPIIIMLCTQIVKYFSCLDYWELLINEVRVSEVLLHTFPYRFGGVWWWLL